MAGVRDATPQQLTTAQGRQRRAGGRDGRPIRDVHQSSLDARVCHRDDVPAHDIPAGLHEAGGDDAAKTTGGACDEASAAGRLIGHAASPAVPEALPVQAPWAM